MKDKDKDKKEKKYYVPDMGDGEPFEVTKEVYDAYVFFMKSMQKYDNEREAKKKKDAY